MPATSQRLREIFDYIFVPERDHPGFPRVTPHVIEPFQKLQFGEIEATALPIFHGERPILSYQFAHNHRRAVYATDCSGIPDESLQRMKGCDVFIVDALRHAAHPNHFSLAQALEIIERIDPGRAFLTHLTHDLGHAATEKELPARVRIATDELELEI